MANEKLQDLIETLKKQGVESGEQAAREIIESARNKGEDILAQARAEAAHIVAKAREEAEKQTKRLQSSMEIAASQFINKLKGTIEENLLTFPLKKEIDGLLSDPGFMKTLMTKFVETYAVSPQKENIQLLLPKEAQEKLRNYAIELMARHYGGDKAGEQLVLSLESQDVKFGFQVSKKSGNVRLDFSNDAFLSLFLGFLSPRFRELFKNVNIGEMVKQ